MPPKKKDVKADKGQQRAIDKQKQKIVEDKTFGLKNKNKSKAVQKYIKGVQQSVKGVQKGGEQNEALLKRQQQDEKKKEALQQALIASLFKGTENIKKVAIDEKRVQYDPKQSREEQKIDLYMDMRLQKDCDWDCDSLIDTNIVCKYFLEAVEKGQYGWFWVCPNDGDRCRYNHKLPEGFVLKREAADEDEEDEEPLEEKLERERAALEINLTPVTKETFEAWKKRKEDERLAEIELARQAEAKKSGGRGLQILTGKDLFQFDPSLFVDDDGAADEEDYEEDEEYWNQIINNNQQTLDNANNPSDKKDDNEEEDNEEEDNEKREDAAGPFKANLFLDDDIPDDLDDFQDEEVEAA